MSFQINSDKEIEVQVQQTLEKEDNTAFEKFIIQCCKSDEWDLRKWLKKVLKRANFQIIEDDYISDRVKSEPRYGTVHNMLAIRGENPRICLAAHTDCCRDSSKLSDKYGCYGERHHWMYGRHLLDEREVEETKYTVTPVVKKVEEDGNIRRVIQDKECIFQVGGDDRLGVAINTYIALNTGYDMGLYFPTDEETGLKSAKVCNMEQLKNFDLIVQTDRGNHSDELVTKIGDEILCSYSTGTRLLEIAYNMKNPRYLVVGAATDVYALKSRNICKEAVNLTVGYHSSFGSSPQEFIDIEESWRTVQYVSEIIKDYDLND